MKIFGIPVKVDPFFLLLVGFLGAGRLSQPVLLVEWLVVVFVSILIHELGHGFTCKHFGGEVHELGFMLIYLQPAFYCDVSDAWSFPEKRARLWVTAAGSWIQLVVASLAAIVWFLFTKKRVRRADYDPDYSGGQ